MLHDAVGESLQQVRELIGLSVSQFDQRPQGAQASIGQHIRHIVDHFWALQEGLITGVVDYNLRHRNSALEKSGDVALDAVEKIQQWIHSLNKENKSLKVQTEVSVSHAETIEVQSNFERELIYVLNHTLHHIAYACLLAKSLKINVPEYLGVAPATATFQREA